MSIDRSASRRIMLSGLAMGRLDSETAVSLLDEDGKTLHTASVDGDGGCELPAEALSSSRQVLVGPISVVVGTDEFCELLDDDTLDVAALLARPIEHAPAPTRASILSASPRPMNTIAIPTRIPTIRKRETRARVLSR